MSKKSKEKPPIQKKEPEKKSIKQVNDLLNHSDLKFDLLSVLVLLALVIIYFWPVLVDGKVFMVPDNTTSLGNRMVSDQAKEEGIFPLWSPYIFSGMPSYGSLMVSGDRWYDFINIIVVSVIRVFDYVFADSISTTYSIYYFFFGLGIYLLLRLKQAPPLVALFSAIGATLSTLSIVWIAVGHNTKIIAVSLMPYLFLMAERIQKQEELKQTVLNVAALGVLFQLLFRSTHVQMIYYTAIALGIYFIFELISVFVQKLQLKPWLRAFSGFVIAALIGLFMSADTYLSILDYTPHSIRGSESITKTYPELSSEAKIDKGMASSGLSYDYATNWSFPPSEVITFFVPSFFGYGDQTYWGDQLFTHSPNFFGALIMVLAIIGFIYNRSKHFVQALGLIGVLALLISFGKYFPVVFDPLFYFLPFFNKFRAPSMILILLQIASCILAGYGLKSILELASEKNEQAKKVFTYLALGISILFVGAVVGASAFQDMYFSAISKSNIGQQLMAQYGSQVPNVIQRYGQPIFDMMKTDLLITLFLLTVLFTGVHFLLQKKVSPLVFQIVLIPLLLVDLWRADAKLLANLNEPQEQKSYFKASPDVEFLKEKQKENHFRILPLTPDRKSSWYAYFGLESVGGYHAAKMRLYQDLIEIVGGGATEYPAFYKSPAMMDLLNIRYIVLNQQANLPGYQEVYSKDGRTILERMNWARRAWLVDSVAVKSPDQILTAIKDSRFNPKHLAFVEHNLSQALQKPDSSASVQLTDWGLQHLTFKVHATGANFMFLSEIYYPEGWECAIDGSPAEIVKTNYAFRGVVVPEGEHEVTFNFKPASFTWGKNISLITNILLTLVFVYLAVDKFKARKQGES